MGYRYYYRNPTPQQIKVTNINLCIYSALIFLAWPLCAIHPHYNDLYVLIFLQSANMLFAGWHVYGGKAALHDPSWIDHFLPTIEPQGWGIPISFILWISIVGLIFMPPKPIQIAVHSGSPEKVERLIQKGANVNERDKKTKDTLLMNAADNGRKEIISVLLANGADINATNKRGQTALGKAISGGNLELVKLLCEPGVDVNAKDNIYYETTGIVEFKDSTLLWTAVRGGHEEIVKFLLDSGAKVNVLIDSFRTPLYEAIRTGNDAIIRLLLESGTGKKLSNAMYEKYLLEAAKSYDAQALDNLIAAGAKAYDYRPAALILAIEKKNVRVAKELLNAPDLIGDKTLKWALHSAINEDLIEIVKKILELGVDPNTRDDSNITALHHAVRQGEEMVQILIDAGAEVDPKDDDGRTPLYFALNEKVARLLVDNGADVNVSDKDKVTPLHLVEKDKIAEVLINAGADVNARDNNFGTPLHNVKFSREISKLLLDAGADINAVDNEGRTPLYRAVDRGVSKYAQPLLIEFLLRAGADYNIKANNGLTPLENAKKKKFKKIIYAFDDYFDEIRPPGTPPKDRVFPIVYVFLFAGGLFNLVFPVFYFFVYPNEFKKEKITCIFCFVVGVLMMIGLALRFLF